MREEQGSSFVDHLGELRDRLIKALVAFFAGACVFYNFTDYFLNIIIKPPIDHVVFTSPAEAFMARMTLTLLGGLLLSLPVVLYQIWQFISLGLTEQERKYIVLFGPGSFVLFMSGVAFANFVMIPISLKFLMSFASPSIVPMINIHKYISFIGTLFLACGMIFELPLILMFLAKIGIATPEFLKQKRKWAIVLIFVFSAIITPPDWISQVLLAIPLIILYEIGIICVQFTQSARNTQEKVRV